MPEVAQLTSEQVAAVTKAPAAVAEPPKLSAADVQKLAASGGVAAAPVLSEAQQALLNDKLAKAAARASKANQPTGDAVYTAPVVAAPLAVAQSELAFLVEPRTLSPYEGLSADTLKAEAEYHQSVDAWKADRARLNDMRRVDDAETITIAKIRQRRDDAAALELALAQQAVGLNRRYVELQQARLPELRDYVAKQAAKLVDVEATVVKRLNGAGVSVQSQLGWPANHHAAEIQFSHVVKQAADWREQQSEVSKAESSVQITADFILPGKQRIGEAEKSLRQKVAKLVA